MGSCSKINLESNKSPALISLGPIFFKWKADQIISKYSSILKLVRADFTTMNPCNSIFNRRTKSLNIFFQILLI